MQSDDEEQVLFITEGRKGYDLLYASNRLSIKIAVATMMIVISLVYLGSASTAYAQANATISERYSVREAGFEILLPDGWDGIQIDRTHAVFSPSDPEVGSDTYITVLFVDRLDTRKIMTSEIDIVSGRPATQENLECDSLDGQIVTLNSFDGKKVFHTIRECSVPDSYRITESYVIFTPTKTVALSLSASSAEAYDRHIASFVDVIQTAKVNDPLNFRSALEIILGTTGIITQSTNLAAADSQVQLLVATSSRISNVSFDEQSKRIIVTLDEIKRSEGSLLVPVNQLLIGPYQVYVDGEQYENFLVITDTTTEEKMIGIWYAQGAHEIQIIGAEVVPEFNIGIVGILAATLSTILLYQRRIFQNVFKF